MTGHSGGLAVLLLSLLFTSGLAAEPRDTLVIDLRVQGGTVAEFPVVIKVTSGRGEEPSQWDATAPGLVRLAPPGGPPWTVQVEAPGKWSMPSLVEQQFGSPLEILLFPARKLVARVVVPKGEELPASVTLRITRRAQSGTAFGEPTLQCPLDFEGRLSCSVPALPKLDLRLRAPGFASKFFWDLDLSQPPPASEAFSLGRLQLHPGASLVGTVHVPPGAELGAVRIRLEPVAASPFGTDTENDAERRLVGVETVDERGFFSLEGLGAGLYRLLVEHPELSSRAIEPVEVLDGAQTELRDPILLTPRRSLKVLVTPAFDPSQQDWTIRVLHVDGAATGRRNVRAEGTTTAGYFEAEGLSDGALEIEVYDSMDMRVGSERIDRDATPDLVQIEVAPIWVEGTVALGDEPLVARITFRGPAEPKRGGSSRATMLADAAGRFSGYLSEAGTWDVRVEAPAPPVQWRSARVSIEAKRGRASLDLDLPDTLLRGTVVEAAGAEVRGARVTVFDRLGVGRPVTSTSDLEGRFAFHGLEEDEYRVEAEIQRGDELWSGQSEVLHVSEDLSPDTTIVVRPKRTLQGRVVDPNGEPVPGAWIEVEPYVGGRLDVMNAGQHRSDLDGSFGIPLPAETTEVRLMVLAPGFALYGSRVPMGDVGTIVLSRLAGTLTVELPGPVPWGDPTALRPFLVDAFGDRTYLGLLVQWAQLNGVAIDLGSDPRRLHIPLLSPGAYSVCWMTFSASYDRLDRGAGCVGGELGPGGALTLRLQPQPRS